MKDPAATVEELRSRAKAARRSMAADERARASRRIADRFLNSRYFVASYFIGCYFSTWDEVDTTAIIARAWSAKKRIFVPATAPNRVMTFREVLPGTRLAMNRFGLWEPVSGKAFDVRKLDVVVTPLVAFDNERNRIGMGSAYFDSTFAFLGERRHWLRPKLISLAFEYQRVEKISPNPWDIRVFRVFTEANKPDSKSDV